MLLKHNNYIEPLAVCANVGNQVTTLVNLIITHLYVYKPRVIIYYITIIVKWLRFNGHHDV